MVTEQGIRRLIDGDAKRLKDNNKDAFSLLPQTMRHAIFMNASWMNAEPSKRMYRRRKL